MDFSQLGNNLETYILAVVAFALLWQLFYFFVFFSRLSFHRAPKLEPFDKPVSVVIAAKNEAENLRQNIPMVMDQDYPDYEVVVVNDKSWDDTESVLEELEAKYENLHVVTIPDKGEDLNFSKKLAVTLGIKGAKHQHIVFTDADCKPEGREWLKNMASGFAQKKQVVLGFGAYERHKGLLNKIIRFDTFQIALQYLSYARAGIPYMGVGRNLAYTKDLFFSVKGFKSHYHIESGDDDLFINQVARRKNTTVIVVPEGHTVSTPKKSWKAWWKQKKRHLTTAGHYRFIHKLLLGLYPLSTMLFFASVIVALLLTNWTYIILGVIGFRLLLQFIIFNGAMRYLGQKDLLVLSPLFEVVMLIMNPMIYISSLFTKKNAWRT